MKKLLILFIALLAACIYYRQPEFCEIAVEEKAYKVYEKNNYLNVNRRNSYRIIDEKVLDYAIYDIDNDENEELLVITYSGDEIYGKDFVIYDTKKVQGKIETKEIYRKDFSDIRPWKVEGCNLDNDGDTDIFIGVHKDTIFYKEVRNRPFFYSWDGKALNKKWLGSFFTEWDLVDIAFGDYYNLGYDLVAVLEKRNKEYRVGVYKFIGFGFENIYTSEVHKDREKLKEKYGF